MEKESRGGEVGWGGERLKGSHVIEGEVQLFAEGFSLQFLRVHLVCRVPGGQGDTEGQRDRVTDRAKRDDTEWKNEENEKGQTVKDTPAAKINNQN